MTVRPHSPNQRGTALLSQDALRKLTTESSTSRFALVTLTLAVAGIAALGVAGWLASAAVLSPIESLLAGSASLSSLGFFRMFVGTVGSLAAFTGGLIALQTTLCLLWQRARPHTERGPNRDVVHEHPLPDAEEDG